MREIRKSGSEGGGTGTNRFSLPLSHYRYPTGSAIGGRTETPWGTPAMRHSHSSELWIPAFAGMTT